ncbi:unnamed protein product [Sphagnum tenellum]
MHLVAGNGAWELADFQPSLSILIPVTLLTLSPRQQRQELLLRSRMKMTSKMRGPPWTKTERTRSAQKTRMDPLTENDRIRSTNECGKLSLEQPANQQPRAEVRTAVLLTATTTETRRICDVKLQQHQQLDPLCMSNNNNTCKPVASYYLLLISILTQACSQRLKLLLLH